MEMVPGALVAERFEIQALTGSGGMGLVYRAHDRHTGTPVALKMLRPVEEDSANLERFLREAQLLAELRHPGVAAYVAHGRTPGGQFFLAMEWLEGEDLGHRLAHKRLDVAESLVLVRGVAEALAAVHRRGIVHRDIKPSNLFLRGGRIDRVTLLDFGIALAGLGARVLTRTGEVVGTLEYLAPERARGERKLGPSADIFSLGCVLYECLTGAPPFVGEHAAVVLARILCEDAVPLRRVRPDMPEALEALLDRMLAKDPAARYADGGALCEALESLLLPASEAFESGALPETAAAGSLLGEEQRLVSVVLALPPEFVSPQEASVGLEETDERPVALAVLRYLLEPYGARVDQLAVGAIVATLSQVGHGATDQAVQAARCAALIKENMPGAVVALTMGRGMLSGELPVGESVERAVGLLQTSLRFVQDRSGISASPVWLDELTAGLLDTRYGVSRAETGLYMLEQERVNLDDTRLLLGKPTPCVGREQELRLLDMLFATCVDEETARVVLVTAPAGVGKSRLRHEFVRRLTSRGETVEVLLGRGDPMHTGTAYGLLGQTLRRLCGLADVVDTGVRRARLTERVGRHLQDEEERHRVVEFLGELCGVPFIDENSALLRAARQDPRIMSEQIGRALVAFLQAECKEQPVLLVLEDLHWGDLATVRLVDRALRELSGESFFVLALARPEIKEQYPKLWEERSVQELRLGGLGRKAAERLATEVLGDSIDPAVVEHIVRQAGGNALFLEELIRAVMEGDGGELPGTMLAMLQARFLRLEPGARRILRAASIFGETFWRGGLIELLGAEPRTADEVDRWLRILVDAEVIVRHDESRFSGEVQYAFRHALLRDAAYSLLTDEDQRAGHRRAGNYLEWMGEADPLVLAEHDRRSGGGENASCWMALAATQALDNGDFAGAIAHAARGVADGATGEVLGTLRSVDAWARIWTCDDQTRAFTSAIEGLELLHEGTEQWCRAVGAALGTAATIGRHDKMVELIQRLRTVEPLEGAQAAFIEPAATAVVVTGLAGMREGAEEFLQRMERINARLGGNEARARGTIELTKGWCRLFLDGDGWEFWVAIQAAAMAFTDAGDQRLLGLAQGYTAIGHMIFGDWEQALVALERALAAVDFEKEALIRRTIQSYASLELAERDEAAYHEVARMLAENVLAEERDSPLWRGLAHGVLARILVQQGELHAAERKARESLDLLGTVPLRRPYHCALLSQVLLKQRRVKEARELAEEAHTVLGMIGGTCWRDVDVLLALALARHAAGDLDGARQAIAQGCRRTLARADKIPTLPTRQSFLEQVAVHARTLKLARAWAAWPA
ncbi:MAG TPA: protein kinase [Polyangia bacterium]|nr:protein kinase [Polyangia bacterium]